MKYFIFILIICSSCFPQKKDFDFHSVPAGIITEIKFFNGCNIYIKTDLRTYIVNGCDDILNVGDSLYEYWIEYKRQYVGKKSSKTLFQIIAIE